MGRARGPNIQLRERRERYQLTQAALAEKIGVNTLTVGRWERGEAVPTAYALKKLCTLLEATPQTLGFEQDQEAGALEPAEVEQPSQQASRLLTRRALMGVGAAGIAVGIGVAAFAMDRAGIFSQASDSASQHHAPLQPATQQTIQPSLIYKGHVKRVETVAWHPTDDAYLASASADGIVRVWQSKDGGDLAFSQCTSDIVNCIAWSPDGRSLALASNRQAVQILPMSPPQPFTLGTCPAPYPGAQGSMSACTWSPDGRWIAAGGQDQILWVWSVPSRDFRFAPLQINSPIATVAWSPDGRSILFGTDDWLIYRCDSSTGRLLSTYKGHTGQVNSVAWSPDGQQFASGSDDGTMRIWNPFTGQLSHICQLNQRPGQDHVDTVAWSADGRYLASGGEGQLVHIWNAQAGTHLYDCAGNTSKINAVAWSHHGYRVASAGQDQSVQIWDLGQVLS